MPPPIESFPSSDLPSRVQNHHEKTAAARSPSIYQRARFLEMVLYNCEVSEHGAAEFLSSKSKSNSGRKEKEMDLALPPVRCSPVVKMFRR